MSGMHADRGDRSHRLVSGHVPQVGMLVVDNDLKVVTITKLSRDFETTECGWYCGAWHETTDAEGKTNISNCERLTASHRKLSAYVSTHPHITLTTTQNGSFFVAGA